MDMTLILGHFLLFSKWRMVVCTGRGIPASFVFLFEQASVLVERGGHSTGSMRAHERTFVEIFRAKTQRYCIATRR